MSRQMTTGECDALVAMIAGVPVEQIVAFAIVVVLEGEPGCECGQPEAHRSVKVVATATDPLLASGILVQGVSSILTTAAEEKFGGGG